jgi:ComF family protein
MKFLKKILEIIFPNHCLYCEEIITAEGLFCSNCWVKLQFITEPKCKICSYPFEIEIKHMKPFCAACLLKRPAYDKVVTIFRYNDVIGKAIGNLKYNDQTFLAKKLAKLLSEKAGDEIIDCDLICAVPLHLKKLRSRKFNQAILLGKYLSKEKFIPDLLWRVADTKPQVALRKKEREKNLKRAFLVNKKYRKDLRGKKILLLDDVMTTGATLENCAKALRKCGVEKITTLTIAKTIFD